MSTLEVADIFRAHGPAWRHAQAGHLSLGQLRVMSAIERCRSAALGGHVLKCPACAHTQIAYNSCRNRHCPKCQASAAQRWLEARQSDLLPVDYYHLVFTLPAPIRDIAWYSRNQTHMPVWGSPVIDAGDTCKGRDQVSRERPVDGNLDSISRCDIGAMEFQPDYGLFKELTLSQYCTGISDIDSWNSYCEETNPKK